MSMKRGNKHTRVLFPLLEVSSSVGGGDVFIATCWQVDQGAGGRLYVGIGVFCSGCFVMLKRYSVQ